MGAEQPDIVVSTAKKEQYSTENGLKVFTDRLRESWRVESSKNVFAESILTRSKLLIFAGPQRKFSAAEFEVLKKFLENGGSIFFWLGDGGEETAGTNVNYFLEEYGMSVNTNSVIRTTYQKYFIPKEALITDGYLQRMSASGNEAVTNQGSVLFPYGTTLRVKKPAVPLLTTGSACFPMHQPVCGFFSHPKGGKLMCLSSVLVFHDSYLSKENNKPLLNRLLSLLFSSKLPRILPDESDIPETEPVYDIAASAMRITPILDEISAASKGSRKLFDSNFESTDLTKITEIVAVFEKVSLPNQPLSLVAPKFEGTLPALQPAVFLPPFEDLPRPGLETFDFSKEFASDKDKLNQVYQGSKSFGIDRFVSDVTSVLTISTERESLKTAKQVLEIVASKILAVKRSEWTD